MQLPIAQIESDEIVQLPTAQLADQPLMPLPNVLAITTFTNHVEIFNRCKSFEESVFYMLYAAHQRLKTEELRRSIVTQTYATLLDKDNHRALQCLVAIELKAVDFEPEFVGKMDMYLEALDRDVKRDNENPSIGIILCPSADRSMVEYTLSRSLSPTMVVCVLRPQEISERKDQLIIVQQIDGSFELSER